MVNHTLVQDEGGDSGQGGRGAVKHGYVLATGGVLLERPKKGGPPLPFLFAHLPP